MATADAASRNLQVLLKSNNCILRQRHHYIPQETLANSLLPEYKKSCTYVIDEDISTISDAWHRQIGSHVVLFESVTINDKAVILQRDTLITHIIIKPLILKATVK